MDTVVQSGNAGSQGGHKSLILDIISLITRLAMAAVWIISGISKLRDSLQTQQAINAYEILPRDVISPLAAGLPVFEIALGGLLLLGVFPRPAPRARPATAAPLEFVPCISGVRAERDAAYRL